MQREEMELERMTADDEDNAAIRSNKRKRSSSQRSRFGWLYMSLGIIFLTIIIATAIVMAVPKLRQSIAPTAELEDNNKMIHLQVLFSTTYTSNSQTQLLEIQNIDDITNQLNAKLNENKIQINDTFFLDGLLSNGYHQMICENPLSGNPLQLNMIAFYSSQCTAQNENTCKTLFVEQLENIFNQMSIISLNIQFVNNRLTSIGIKMCNLIEMTVENNLATPYMVLKRSTCNLNLGHITLVQLDGEDGTRILDDTPINTVSNDDPYRQYLTVTLYEDMNYRIHIQFNCNAQSQIDSRRNNCDLSETVNVWIDYNNDGYDDEESQVLKPTSTNTYDLDLYIPSINNREIRDGIHKMRIAVTPSVEYLNDCGYVDHKEVRHYTVNIVPKGTYAAPVTVPPANINYKNPVCSQNSGRITLVLMAGERATEIRDDNPPTTSFNDYQNRHHLAVTIYEHTIYILRVQLDCSWQLNSELVDRGCNLVQDISVWIDLNDDGQFDQSELGTPYRWPVTSYLPQGNYDLQLTIPLINNRYMRTGKHQMRIVVQSSDYYRIVCKRIDYNETRDYTVNIIPRTGYVGNNLFSEWSLDTTEGKIPYTILNNIVCSRHAGKINLVIMAGEHRTQIRDDSSTRTVLNSDNENQQHQAIVLYEGTVYLTRIQLDCSQQWNSDSLGYHCHLIYDVDVRIDLNDDGIFDSSESAVPFRWPLNSYAPKGVYDLQMYVPVIDGNRVRTGPHRMQLVVTMSEYYQQKCNDNDYRETREYIVSIVSNTRLSFEVDPKIPLLKLSDNVCSLNNGKMALVIMAGEQGTEIRDNIATNTVLSETQNRHNLSVTLYEGIFYRLRVTLDCHPRSSGDLPEINCNLAQDVNVYIDLNNDDRFDETESRVSQRWPLRSTIPLGIYDFEIEIPMINRQYTRSNTHKMRIVVLPSEEYYKKCGRIDYRDTREYTINIIPRAGYPVTTTISPTADYGLSYCSVGNLVCAVGANGIALVNLIGEENTTIYDEQKTCKSENNYYDQSNVVVTLYESSTYPLQIELFCVEDERYGGATNDDTEISFCNRPKYIGVWIDYNNDGTLDENQGEMISNNWYEENHHTTTYDLTLNVPHLDHNNRGNQQHKMRVLFTENGNDRKPCYNSGYGEARDYTVEIISNPSY